jgi:hypothetical protein
VNTTEIEELANQDGLATTDMEAKLRVRLRRMVLPEFFKDIDRRIGRVHWRRRSTTIAVVAPTRNYDLPSDFDKFSIVQRSDSTAPNNLGSELNYIGEDDDLVIESEAATETAPPTGYSIVAGTLAVDGAGIPKRYALRLSRIPDNAYTLYGVYYRMVPFVNDNAPVDLDPYIPWDVQGGLVKRLRMYILEDRVGIRDNRYALAKEEYGEWINSLEFAKEPAQRTKVVSVR